MLWWQVISRVVVPQPMPCVKGMSHIHMAAHSACKHPVMLVRLIDICTRLLLVLQPDDLWNNKFGRVILGAMEEPCHKMGHLDSDFGTRECLSQHHGGVSCHQLHVGALVFLLADHHAGIVQQVLWGRSRRGGGGCSSINPLVPRHRGIAKERHGSPLHDPLSVQRRRRRRRPVLRSPPGPPGAIVDRLATG